MFMRKNKIEDPEFCFSLSRKQMVSRLHFAGILMVADVHNAKTEGMLILKK